DLNESKISPGSERRGVRLRFIEKRWYPETIDKYCRQIPAKLEKGRLFEAGLHHFWETTRSS
ncbi:MAG: hypothetical protein ACMG6H_02160, partial [Acidobacteriota bacterium]